MGEAYHIRINLHPFHINKMLSTAGADRLQTCMRHSFGKPYGSVARVKYGATVMQCRTNKDGLKHAIEALRRASFKFPGTTRVVVSTKVGFSPYSLQEYKDYLAVSGITECGNHMKRVYRRGSIPTKKEITEMVNFFTPNISSL
jgi:large subunit ribosomal protein L10e